MPAADSASKGTVNPSGHTPKPNKKQAISDLSGNRIKNTHDELSKVFSPL
ncbi:hypothetical protein [Mucilaginibacter ginsenosidivorax]|nr:hypothetical protein [Mucilaginibacter ginsenosidivorax]